MSFMTSGTRFSTGNDSSNFAPNDDQMHMRKKFAAARKQYFG